MRRRSGILSRLLVPFHYGIAVAGPAIMNDAKKTHRRRERRTAEASVVESRKFCGSLICYLLGIWDLLFVFFVLCFIWVLRLCAPH